MVKINPKSKIWFLTRIGKDIEWRIEKRKRICLQNLILSRSEREFFSKSRISRGEREFFLQNLDIREHLEKWKFNSTARDRKKWNISSRDFLEIENLVNACSTDHFLLLSCTPSRFPLKLALKLKDFPSWRPQVFVSCNKSIRTKQANPSTDTAISMGNGLVCWIKTKSDRLSTAIKI